MTRHLRKFSNSKIYHIIIKGIDAEDIFYDDMDRNVFLEKIKLTKKEFNYEVYAYCLMTNHVHMVIKVLDEDLSRAVQSLTIRYVSYFNKKYDRKGPFVQNRFNSKNIENQKYFLEVCRYVHRNPEKANLEKTNKYKWSSYREYIGNEKIINRKVLLHYFGNNIENFISYTNKVESVSEMINIADFELENKLSDDEVIKIILNLFNLNSVTEIISFFKDRKQIKKLNVIKNIHKNQIARIIRVDRKTVSKYFEE